MSEILGIVVGTVWLFSITTACVLFAQYGLRFVLSYRITDRSIQILLFEAVPINRVRFDRIEEIKIISFGKGFLYGFAAVNFPNRVWGPRVLIRSYGWAGLVITPDEPDEFVEEVRRRLSREDRT